MGEGWKRGIGGTTEKTTVAPPRATVAPPTTPTTIHSRPGVPYQNPLKTVTVLY